MRILVLSFIMLAHNEDVLFCRRPFRLLPFPLSLVNMPLDITDCNYKMKALSDSRGVFVSILSQAEISWKNCQR